MIPRLITKIHHTDFASHQTDRLRIEHLHSDYKCSNFQDGLAWKTLPKIPNVRMKIWKTLITVLKSHPPINITGEAITISRSFK